MAKILLVDDEKSIRITLSEFLKEDDHEVQAVATAKEACKLLKKQDFDVVVTDIILPGTSGIELFKKIKEHQPLTQVIIITGEPTIETAAEAVRSSAFDYLPKPVDGEDLKKVVAKAVKVKKLTEEQERLRTENLRYQQHLEELIELRTRALKESEKTFRLMFENNPMPMIIFDLETHKILAANHSASVLYGYAIEELLGAPVEEIFTDPESIPSQVIEKSTHTIQESKEIRHRTKNGSIIEVEILSHFLLYENRKACYVMIKDITERKRTEQALIRSERKYRMLYENMAQGVFYLNDRGQIISINETGRKILHFPKEKNVLTLDFFKSFKFFDQDGNSIKFEQFPPLLALQGGLPVINQILKVVRPDGEERWLIFDSVPHLQEGKVTEVFTTVSDITLLKQTESELRVNEQKLRAVFNALPDQLLLLSREGQILEIKDDYMFNQKAQTLIGQSLFDVFQERLAQRFYNLIRLTNRTGSIQTFEYQYEVNGKLRNFEARLIKSAEGQILCLIRDITERKRYEVDLQKSEARFRILLESASQAIVLIDMHGRINLVNSQTERLFGYTRDELLSQPVEILLPFSLRGRDHILSLNNFRHFGAYPTQDRVELTGMRKDGSEFPFEIQLSSVEMLEGPFVMALITDISERKKLESRIRRIEKLEAIGQLAGGIAHDFNNVLAGIIGLSELSLRKMEEKHPARENLKLIINKAESAADLVRKLLMFSRQQKITPRPINLNQVVLSNQKLLQRYLGEDIHLIIRLSDDLNLIHGDPSAMDQIITNLCINARDAMPDGGELTIQTRNVRFDDSTNDLPAGNYVQLIISDTGIGMSEEVQKHIFEPFFTTKELGQGTGLGLATVYGLVKQHDGSIQFNSQLGEGTIFRIYFPAIEEKSTARDTDKEGQMVRGGSETLLLVDDQIDILTTSKETLESYGYKVLIAGNGIQALEILEKYKDIIDLVISDVVMPDMDGIELRMFCKRIKPSLKFLLMSAFSPKLEGEKDYILKPFVGHQLARKVREILDA